MSNESFRFKIGHFNCLAINDSQDRNRNCLLIDTGQHKVLIDTGNGDATSPRGLLLDRLHSAGISPADIDVIILSHGDIDHIAGLIDESGNLTFPRARYVLADKEWVFWSTHTLRTSPKHHEMLGEEWTQLVEKIPRTLLAQLRDTLELIESETEVVPGIWAIAAPGHTPGMMVVAVSSCNEQLLFIADVIYSVDLNNDQRDDPKVVENQVWHAAVDVDPTQATVTRDRLFEQAARTRTLLMAYHLPFPGLGYVMQHGPDWRWQSLKYLSYLEQENTRHEWVP